jgi:hypothetical protein
VTEQTTTRSVIFAADPEGRCHSGRATDHPCERQATEYRWPDAGEPTLCAEHMRAAELSDQADDLRDALDRLHEWIQSLSTKNDALIHAVYDQRDALERRYLEVLGELQGALVVANGRVREGQREYPKVSQEERDKEFELGLAHLRADAFNDARAILEDLPEEAFGRHDRWVLCGILAAAHDAANTEHERISAGVWAR